MKHLLFSLVFMALFGAPSAATDLIHDVSILCGVKEEALRAIVCVESGLTKNVAWPWTIQVRGKSLYFKKKALAVSYAQKLLTAQIRNFDCGLAQVNWRWHGHKFANLEAAFDPKTNVVVAARFLKEGFRRHKDWSMAAGFYHGGSAQERQRYRNNIKKKGFNL